MMMQKEGWRDQSSSKRRKLLTALVDGQTSLRGVSRDAGRGIEVSNFFIDFWRATPHPIAQLVMLVTWSILVATVNDARVLGLGAQIDSNAGRAMQTILAFLIVFRTNQSYNRWWEGRILWGKMHWSCVELTQEAAIWIENTQLARRIMNFTIAYAYTVKQYLRREQLFAEDLEGFVDVAEVEWMNSLPAPVMPYYCTDVIRQCIKKGLTESPQAFGTQAVARGIDIPVSQLSMQFADMSRVRNTPQPTCFKVMLHFFTLLYLLVLPLLSYDVLGYFVIPEVLVTSYLMLGLQIAASDLEEPFGRDQEDLELDLFVANIAAQCRNVFYFGTKKGIDLTRDGGGTTPIAGADGGGGGSGGGSETSYVPDARSRGAPATVSPPTAGSASPDLACPGQNIAAGSGGDGGGAGTTVATAASSDSRFNDSRPAAPSPGVPGLAQLRPEVSGWHNESVAQRARRFEQTPASGPAAKKEKFWREASTDGGSATPPKGGEATKRGPFVAVNGGGGRNSGQFAILSEASLQLAEMDTELHFRNPVDTSPTLAAPVGPYLDSRPLISASNSGEGFIVAADAAPAASPPPSYSCVVSTTEVNGNKALAVKTFRAQKDPTAAAAQKRASRGKPRPGRGKSPAAGAGGEVLNDDTEPRSALQAV